MANDVWEIYRQVAGRDPTAQERNWVANTADQQYFGGPEGTYVAHAQYLKQLSDSIKAEASSLGMTLTDAEANQIRDAVNPSGLTDATRTSELSRNMLSTKLQEKTTAQQKEEIDKALHPEKYLDETTASANKQAVAQQFQSILGRDANAEELDYFANELAKGTSAYELQNLLKGTPEYLSAKVKAESEAAQSALSTKMQGFSDEAFKRALPQIMSSYMKAGRINSSGIDAAIAKAKEDMASQQNQYLAGLSYDSAVRQEGYNREDYVNSTAAAWNQYLQQQQQQASAQKSALTQYGNYATYESPWQAYQNQVGALSGLTARDRELSDYARQQSDYQQYLDKLQSQNRENAMYGLAGSLLGSAVNAGLYQWAGR